MQRRRKVGGIVDRRFGEDDPSMTLEQRNLQRFVREKNRSSFKHALFDLEGEWEADDSLTHLGRSVTKSSQLANINVRSASSSSEGTELEFPEEDKISSHLLESRGKAKGDLRPESKQQRGKKEVMEEVIAKSKFQKYERQKAKEDDDDLRAELDQGLTDLYSMLRSPNRGQSSEQAMEARQGNDLKMNPDRLALLEGKDRSQADKEYDERLRQMLLDQRATPSAPTLTAEQRETKEVDQLRAVEESRAKRMSGATSDLESDTDNPVDEVSSDENVDVDTAKPYQIDNGLSTEMKLLDVEAEDSFLIDDDLPSIVSDSEREYSNASKPNSGIGDGDHDDHSDSDIFEAEKGVEEVMTRKKSQASSISVQAPCPTSHDTLLQAVDESNPQEMSQFIQRVRKSHQPGRGEESKRKLGRFAAVLVEHIYHLASSINGPSFANLEPLIRHVHSLAKTFGIEVANAFRAYLRAMQTGPITKFDAGDLLILISIGSIYPTSDHFHQVVTPAMLCMTRYLAWNLASAYSDIITGSFICTLCISYQRLSRRIVPEIPRFVLNALKFIRFNDIVGKESPRPRSSSRNLSGHEIGEQADSLETTSFSEIQDSHLLNHSPKRYSVTYALLTLIETMSTLWADHPAFCESLGPLHEQVRHLTRDSQMSRIQEKANRVAQHLENLMLKSFGARKPLQLHNHRPLPIKTSVPKFDLSFNPDKHNDPDRERSELSKLKAQHKKERKGALRELRKDSNFIARENLREKKESDAAYDKKFKRLVAEIQGEEGHEAKMYERDKRMRRGKR